jgi:hypothetical protein
MQDRTDVLAVELELGTELDDVGVDVRLELAENLLDALADVGEILRHLLAFGVVVAEHGRAEAQELIGALVQTHDADDIHARPLIGAAVMPPAPVAAKPDSSTRVREH